MHYHKQYISYINSWSLGRKMDRVVKNCPSISKWSTNYCSNAYLKSEEKDKARKKNQHISWSSVTSFYNKLLEEAPRKINNIICKAWNFYLLPPFVSNGMQENLNKKDTIKNQDSDPVQTTQNATEFATQTIN